MKLTNKVESETMDKKYETYSHEEDKSVVRIKVRLLKVNKMINLKVLTTRPSSGYSMIIPRERLHGHCCGIQQLRPSSH